MRRPVLAVLESNTSGTGRRFVQAAAESGFRPLLLTSDPMRYPYVARDGVETLRLDTQDLAAVLAACRGLTGLAGITTSSEYFVCTAAAVAHELGLPAPDWQALEECRDKGVQRRKLAAAGLPSPCFQVVRSVDDGLSAGAALGLDRGRPVVVKPVSGTGSIAVRLCTTPAEVAEAARAILARRHNERGMPLARRYLVESLVAGPEISVETFGREVVGITRKHLGEPPAFVETGHDFPVLLDGGEAREVCRTALQALDILGLGWGPAHLEIRLAPEGPTIIEVNPRLAGGMIPELVRLAFGVDLVQQTVLLAGGGEPDLRLSSRRSASIRFLLADREGVFLEACGLDAARQAPGVAGVELYLSPGRRFERQGDFRDRLGHVIAIGCETRESAARAEQARARVHLRWQQ